MTGVTELNYTLHHLCIYDDKPRENMMPYLRWHHGITNYFSGAVFHVTGEGHSDYTFMGCGGRAYQIQIEAPPFQFEYERNWWSQHGHGYNHICWITSNARASMDHLLNHGAREVMPFEEFPTYDGFVVHDPEGRWIEIMEYTNETFRVQEFTHAPSGECGLEMVGTTSVCNDVDAMTEWYGKVMDLRVLETFENDGDKWVVMTDQNYDPIARRSFFILQNARTEQQKTHKEQHGAYISEIVYQAKDVQRAYDDALWAGMESLHAPERDPLTGLLCARVLEPCGGNVLLLLEHYAPAKTF
ncbi:glyoxalase [Pseudomaricurvus alkylphenolicus]|uniref:VOC family protein n=1 Tax=Pseudomaricurvus alkylphenolicus TaxID=1306991 RepID=UPI00141DA024|nr:VOC family protein [Pseudomaricurvus alkylphenolicus]NIB40977.1 glyoxalase [Pseudomaricurvus alkylphenolicus]